MLSRYTDFTRLGQGGIGDVWKRGDVPAFARSPRPGATVFYGGYGHPGGRLVGYPTDLALGSGHSRLET